MKTTNLPHRSLWILMILFGLTACNRAPITGNNTALPEVSYHVDLNGIENDTFTVVVDIPSLSKANDIFQFAATAPGTYQVMDVGRFVSQFRSFDADGKELPVARAGVNQYQFQDPHAVRKVTYKVAETWDTPVPGNSIYPMCGTSIEEDHVLFNPHAVLGYIKGLQAAPIRLQLDYPEAWIVGTALVPEKKGLFGADSYDHLVDSPILLGKLSKASTKVDDTVIDIYTYSRTGMISSDEILASTESLLASSSYFLEGLPVDRYTFLFHFEDKIAGAWEHSYSSEYVFPEYPWEELEEPILSTISHEFFHIVTPLNIHSEVISQFDFVEPQPSDHLWLYEGVTEWAANMILLQGKQIDMEEYFDRMQTKLITADKVFDKDISIRQLARTSFTDEGQKQYINIYNRGAIVAGLLDLMLLKESDGEQSLRQLIVELARDYGPDRPFSEKKFFKDLKARTTPEISDFLRSYIEKTKPLPLEEYYSWIGVDYIEEVVDSSRASTGMMFYPLPSGMYVISTPPSVGQQVQKTDVIHTINGQPANAETWPEIKEMLAQMKPGTEYEIGLYRENESLKVRPKLIVQTDFHIFRVRQDATPEQLALRKKWSRQAE